MIDLDKKGAFFSFIGGNGMLLLSSKTNSLFLKAVCIIAGIALYVDTIKQLKK